MTDKDFCTLIKTLMYFTQSSPSIPSIERILEVRNIFNEKYDKEYKKKSEEEKLYLEQAEMERMMKDETLCTS